MKRLLYIGFTLITTLFVTSCGKDFLNVTPIDNLSGNNYWKTKADFEQFTGGIYSTFREATMRQIFFPATGDFRCAPINRAPGSNGAGATFNHLTYLKFNDLKSLFAQYYKPERAFGENNDYFGFQQVRKWNNFFLMVQKANILYYQLENVGSGILSEADIKKYKAEAVFLRNLAYFFMVRVWGDVPYYTQAFHSTPSPRVNFVEILQKGIADMSAHYKDLPWTYEDQSIVAIRAMRGSAIALMMHMNMWVAGFSSNKTPFYEATAALGKEIMEENGGAYTLLPLERTKEIFKGRTKEGLFEIAQNFNYGESFHLSSTFSDYVLRAPNKVVTRSYIYYSSKFLEKLYPPGERDLRKSYWFDEFMYNTEGQFQMLKFVNVFMEEGEDNNPDDNQVVFRYNDAIMLRAEALAELERDGEAKLVINEVRRRAGAKEAASENGKDLKDLIWYERARELMGEGHWYYDLVRTKKVINAEYTEAPMSVDAFNRGGWTWPIDQSAFANNPFMTYNAYWN
ncbi:RagB/SusD family nutrient uptake outer membrane protein [Sphingobacterium spiritivorum]|uniref:RagB/SusD family nutrient uptake outer membrane protein n=1 Tax=Sphingobacterium spiritivorum TaxID=258 RepID=UPI0036B4FED6